MALRRLRAEGLIMRTFMKEIFRPAGKKRFAEDVVEQMGELIIDRKLMPVGGLPSRKATDRALLCGETHCERSLGAAGGS